MLQIHWHAGVTTRIIIAEYWVVNWIALKLDSSDVQSEVPGNACKMSIHNGGPYVSSFLQIN